MKASERTVRVRLRLPEGADVPSGSTLRLRIEDVTAADRASDVIAESDMIVRALDDLVTTDVSVPLDLIDPAASYSVFVHLDTTNSGDIEVGDFLSPQAHLVLTHGAPEDVDVSLIQVGGSPPNPAAH